MLSELLAIESITSVVSIAIPNRINSSGQKLQLYAEQSMLSPKIIDDTTGIIGDSIDSYRG